eukprot:3181986-Rhodomonas_salina.1
MKSAARSLQIPSSTFHGFLVRFGITSWEDVYRGCVLAHLRDRSDLTFEQLGIMSGRVPYVPIVRATTCDPRVFKRRQRTPWSAGTCRRTLQRLKDESDVFRFVEWYHEARGRHRDDAARGTFSLEWITEPVANE